MLALHGFKLLIISFIRRFSVVCNSILYFCVCYDAVIAWAWLQSKVCPTSEWNSVCFVLFLGKADYCRRKDKKLPQRGHFCAYMRHKVIEDSVISSIITIWKPVCLLFFKFVLILFACTCTRSPDVRMYIIMSVDENETINCLRLLKMKQKWNFLSEIFGSFENS